MIFYDLGLTEHFIEPENAYTPHNAMPNAKTMRAEVGELEIAGLELSMQTPDIADIASRIEA